MSFHTRLQYYPLQLAASVTVPVLNSAIGGVFCVTSGTITVSGYDDQGVLRVVVPAFSPAAGTWTPLPFWIGANGGTVTTGAGFTGVLAT